MHTEKTVHASLKPGQDLTDLDQAVNYIAAAVANLHEAAQHLKNCNANGLTQNIVQAREEIRKFWRGIQQIRYNRYIGGSQGNPGLKDPAGDPEPGERCCAMPTTAVSEP